MLALGGCYSPSAPTGAPCTDDTQCPSSPHYFCSTIRPTVSDDPNRVIDLRFITLKRGHSIGWWMHSVDAFGQLGPAAYGATFVVP